MPKTGSGRNSTSTDHMLQIEKPMCSEKIEKKRLRRAIGRPVVSQKAGASGRQFSIPLPRFAGGCGGATAVVRGALVDGGRVGAAMGRQSRDSVSPASP